jgi:primosomal protein N'
MEPLITRDGIRVAKLIGKLTYESFAHGANYRQAKCEWIDDLSDDNPVTVREMYNALDWANQRTFNIIALSLPQLRPGVIEVQAFIARREKP